MKPIGLRIVADLASSVKIPISGVGGIYDWRDALEYLLLGATTVQVCTAVLQRGFGLINPLRDGLSRWLEDHQYRSPAEVIGLALVKLTEHEKLTHGVKVVSRIDMDTCIGCGLCYVACADGGHMAIEFPADRRPVVQEGLCVGCGLMCPGLPGAGLYRNPVANPLILPIIKSTIQPIILSTKETPWTLTSPPSKSSRTLSDNPAFPVRKAGWSKRPRSAMKAAGFDRIWRDAAGNLIGELHG